MYIHQGRKFDVYILLRMDESDYVLYFKEMSVVTI